MVSLPTYLDKNASGRLYCPDADAWWFEVLRSAKWLYERDLSYRKVALATNQRTALRFMVRSLDRLVAGSIDRHYVLPADLHPSPCPLVPALVWQPFQRLADDWGWKVAVEQVGYGDFLITFSDILSSFANPEANATRTFFGMADPPEFLEKAREWEGNGRTLSRYVADALTDRLNVEAVLAYTATKCKPNFEVFITLDLGLART